MSAPTGASALLVLLTAPGAVAIERDGVQFMPPETSPARCVVRARRSLRNAIRRLVRAHGGRVGPAAQALGVAPSVLRAGAAAVGLTLPSVPGRRPAAKPQPGETWEDSCDGERVLLVEAMPRRWFRCQILVPMRCDRQRGLGPPPGDCWERRIVTTQWTKIS